MQEALPARRSRPGRVFLGPLEIAGHYANLEAALRKHGVDALAVDLFSHPFGYRQRAADPVPVRLARWARTGRREATGSVSRVAWALPAVALTVLLLAWAVIRFDTFVFGFRQSLLGLRELPLLRRLGKRVIFVFHGSDARPPYIDGTQMAPDRAVSIEQCIAVTRRTKADIRRIERYADAIVAQPAFCHFFERPVVSFFALGVPWRDRPVAVEAASSTAGGTTRILHSPSDATVKGSARIREVVNELAAEGLPLELVELRGVPNDVVWRELARCDFAIDQIYSDAPMVGFATEAAVAGKPSIVGGYAWPENHRLFGSRPVPPVEECTPESLSDAVRRLAGDRDHRAQLGRQAQRWVLDTWSAPLIAERYIQVFERHPDAAWMFDPMDLRYVEGCGLSREEARSLVRAMLAVGGTASLCVSDKPDLEAAFVAFAEEDS
ncbi:MAG: glycosyltransferase [Chloroflexota bacterium]